MIIKHMQPRYWLAFFLGLLSIFALTSIYNNPRRPIQPAEPEVIITTGTVKLGQTLARILEDHKLSTPYIYKVQKTLGDIYNLRYMIPGHTYEIITSTDGIFQKFQYHTDDIHTYVVSRSTSGKYTNEALKEKTVWVEKKVTCTIKDNLYKDLLGLGHSENLVANLVSELGDNIFAWRIDFFTEQRPGDEVVVLFEQEHRLGSQEPIKGKRLRVLVANYKGSATEKSQNYAFRYQAPGESAADYFNENGEAVRKAFLRAPFSHGGFRISSYFNPKRYHPIKRIYRPHHGIDYASPTGTPVVAVGKGKVILAGWNGAYGKCIEVRHSNKYVSRYGHLSRLGVKMGQSVEQGQYIGNVGTTGLSTGPHLHFEMMDNGRRRDFLKMEFPSAKSVSAKSMDHFNEVKGKLFAKLTQDSDLTLVKNK